MENHTFNDIDVEDEWVLIKQAVEKKQPLQPISNGRGLTESLHVPNYKSKGNSEMFGSGKYKRFSRPLLESTGFRRGCMAVSIFYMETQIYLLGEAFKGSNRCRIEQ